LTHEKGATRSDPANTVSRAGMWRPKAEGNRAPSTVSSPLIRFDPVVDRVCHAAARGTRVQAAGVLRAAFPRRPESSTRFSRGFSSGPRNSPRGFSTAVAAQMSRSAAGILHAAFSRAPWLSRDAAGHRQLPRGFPRLLTPPNRTTEQPELDGRISTDLGL
jgi:hypothetical protein